MLLDGAQHLDEDGVTLPKMSVSQAAVLLRLASLHATAGALRATTEEVTPMEKARWTPLRPAISTAESRARVKKALGLIDVEDGLVGAEVVDDVAAQVITYGIGVPVGRVEEPLHAIGGGLSEQFGQRPAVLAVASREEAL